MILKTCSRVFQKRFFFCRRRRNIFFFFAEGNTNFVCVSVFTLFFSVFFVYIYIYISMCSLHPYACLTHVFGGMPYHPYPRFWRYAVPPLHPFPGVCLTTRTPIWVGYALQPVHQYVEWKQNLLSSMKNKKKCYRPKKNSAKQIQSRVLRRWHWNAWTNVQLIRWTFSQRVSPNQRHNTLHVIVCRKSWTIVLFLFSILVDSIFLFPLDICGTNS